MLQFGDKPSAFATGGVTVTLTALSQHTARLQLGEEMKHTFAIRPTENSLPLRLLVDHLSVEAFAAGGRGVASTIVEYNATSATPLVWPTAPPLAYVFGAGQARATAAAWGMGCGWEDGIGSSGSIRQVRPAAPALKSDDVVYEPSLPPPLQLDPSNGTCPKPASPPPPANSACALPRWNASWAMRESSYSYCYGHCPLNSLLKNSQYGLWGGVVGVDHYYTHQGMPCHDGVPDEFQAQDKFAISTKAVLPKARVLQYRITDAVPYAPIVHNKMVADPEFFIRWHGTGPTGLNNGSICTVPKEHQTGRPGDNCSWEIRAGAYDWTQPRVRQWYLENVIYPTLKHGDGAWIDGDGPDNGAFQCSGTTHNRSKLPTPYPALDFDETAAFRRGEWQVKAAAQRYLIENGGYEYGCISFFGRNSDITMGFYSNKTSAVERLSKIRGLMALDSDNKTIGMFGGRIGAYWPNGDCYSRETLEVAVALFLLARGEHWLFVLPNSNEIDSASAKLLLSDFGPARGNMSVAGTVAQREYAMGTVSLDCATLAVSLPGSSLNDKPDALVSILPMKSDDASADPGQKFAAISIVARMDAGVQRVIGSTQKHARNPLFVQDTPQESRIDNGYPNVVAPTAAEPSWQLWYGTCGVPNQAILCAPHPARAPPSLDVSRPPVFCLC